ncbi:Uncharacterised protein [Mycobacteroides abscessus subsp. abscessus]|nr:Uncharacterised protein [Mycobacteroides abscessus subsp. abscessus]
MPGDEVGEALQPCRVLYYEAIALRGIAVHLKLPHHRVVESGCQFQADGIELRRRLDHDSVHVNSTWGAGVAG